MAGEYPKRGDVLVMVGTRKGTFLFWSDERRRNWQHGAHHMGWGTNAVTYDPRHNAIYAATNSFVFGGVVQRSCDGGQTWEVFNQGLDFPAEEERRVREVWQVTPGHANRPDEVWAGTREAGLFRSPDRGVHWEGVTSLNNRHEADKWEPGGGGLILHTILPDPNNSQRLYVAISTGGAYRTDDGGASWTPINRNVEACYAPDPFPETGQCVHKMALHPANSRVLFQQNHCGVYRSDNQGDSWVDISEGLPSRFGFPMALHAHDPHTAFVVPLKGDDQRVVPEGQMAVWRTNNDGNSWQQMRNGLPDNAWLTVLRDAMDTDDCTECGVYVGTTGGQVFHSRDAGVTWETLADFLPAVHSVRAARVVG